MRKLTLAIIFISTAYGCKDDVRIVLTGASKSAMLERFSIQSTANLTTRDDYTLEWSEIAPDKEYEVSIAKNEDCSDELVSKKNIKDTKILLDFLADGQYYLCIYSTIKNEKVGASNNGISLVIDKTEPLVKIPSLPPSHNKKFTPDIVIEDLTEVTVVWSQEKGPGTLNFLPPDSLQPEILADVDGGYKIRAVITDKAGNKVEQFFHFNWDSSGPAIKFGAPMTTAVAKALPVTIDSSALRFKWSFSGGPAGGKINFSDDKVKAPLVSASKEGSYQVVLTAYDEAGNESSDTVDFTWDITPPTFNSVVLSGPLTDGYLNSQDRNLSTPFLGSLDADGYTSIAYRVTNGGTTCSSSLTYTATIPKANTSEIESDGSHKVCIKLKDDAGLMTFAESSLFVVDTIPAVFNSIALAGAVIDGLLSNAERLIDSDLVNGLQANDAYLTEYALVSEGTPCSGPLTYGTAIPKSSHAGFTAAGDYRVCVRVIDIALNPAGYGQSPKITYTIAGPTFNSLAKSAEASDGFINDSEKSGSSPLWILNQTGADSIAYSAALPDPSGTLVCDASQTYSQGTTVARAVDLASDGAFSLCVELRDAAGLITYGKAEQVMRDTVSPILTSLLGAHEASDGVVINDEKTSTSAAWALVASGSTLAAYTSPLDDAGAILTCDENKTYNQTAIPQIAAITSDGTRAVCVRLRDAAGNTIYGKSQALLRDTIVPVFTSLVAINEASDGFISSSEAASTADLLSLNASGYDSLAYTGPLDNTPAIVCDAAQNYNQSTVPTVNQLMADESFAVCVRLSDANGNFTYGKSQTIVRSTGGPVVLSFNATAEGSDGYINNSEKNATVSLWSLDQSGATTIAYSSALDDTAGALVCNAGQTYNQGTTIARAADLPSDGAWSICVRMGDSLGNTSYGKGQQIVRDIAPPSLTSLALSGAATDAYINDSEKLLISALWELTASGHAQAQYTTALDDTAGAVTCDQLQTYTQSNIVTPASLNQDIAYALCVKLTDSAGNIAYGKSASLVRDTNLPTFTSLNGANAASDGAIKSGEEGSGLALFTLAGSGYTGLDYTSLLSDNPSVDCDSSQTYDQNAIPLISSMNADGVFALCVRLSDDAGNHSYGKSQSIERDIVAPTFTSLLAANEASDGYINDSEKASSAQAWSLDATDFSTVAYTLALDDTAAGVTCDGTQTYGQGSIPQILSMASDKPWAVCVKLSDGVGNISYGKSQQIIREIVAPSFTSLLGANEAADGLLNDAEAASNLALVTLSATGHTGATYTLALIDNPAITCDGNQTYDQSSAPLISDLTSDESYAVCVSLSDAAGNIAYGKSQQINRDNDAPTFTSLDETAQAIDGFINDSEKAATNAIWTLVANGYTSAAYTAALDDTGGAQVCDGSDTYDQGTTLPTAATLSSDGAWTVCVKLLDAAGNITYGKATAVVRDIVGPSFTSLAVTNAASDSYINDSEKLLLTELWSLTATDHASAAYTIALDDTGAALACNASKTYDQSAIAIPASLSVDGPFALCVKLLDSAGNPTYGKSAPITRDTSAPSFTSLNGVNEASNLLISIGEEASNLALFSLVASGQSSQDYTIPLSDDPTAVTCDNSLTYDQANIPLVSSITADGKFAVCVKLSDAAGNFNFGKSQQVERDVDPPAFTSLLGADGASDGYINDSEKSSSSEAWVLSATGYATATYTLALDDTAAAVTCDAAKTYNQSNIPSLVHLSSDGPWAICVKLVDTASNITYGKSQQIIRDIVAPTLTSLNGANGATDGYINSSEAASPAALLTLNATGHALAEYTAVLDDTPAVTCDASQTYNQGVIAQIDSLGADDSYALCVKLSDSAGNIAYGKSQVIVKDTSAPAFTSLMRAAEATDSYINDSEKNATNALWTLTASGASALAYSAALDDSAGAQICDASDSYNQGSTVATAASIGSDGAWTLCVQLSDAAGNITYGKGQQITRDILAPTLTSLSVANAAADTYINDSEKLLANAMWTLSASGQASADYTTALDDTGGALACNAGKTYDQSSIATPSSLSADGPYALCVKLTDSAGNISYGKSAQITRDIAPPTFTSLVGANAASDLFIKIGEESSNAALYALTASGHSTDDFTVALSDDPAAVSCNSGQTYDQANIPLISSVSSDGKFAVCAKITDAAGNNSYGKSQQVERDTDAPVFTSLLRANGASDGYINDSEKASTALAWALTASGHVSDDFTLPLDDSGAALVCDVSKTYGQADIPQIDAMASDLPWAVCVKLTDSAGNISYGKSQQVIRDTVPPTLTSLNGANGASDLYINSSEAASTAALLTLSASNYDTVNYTLALDDTPSVTCDGGQTYAQSAIALIDSLGADDSYAVCVRLLDTAGNVAYGKS